LAGAEEMAKAVSSERVIKNALRTEEMPRIRLLAEPVFASFTHRKIFS
jgi:hypothetical protein